MADPASAPFGTPFDIARTDALDGVPHGFFGSAGGAHQFGFGGPGDERAILDLRSGAADEVLAGAPLMAPHQVHSPDVVTIGHPPHTRKWPDQATGRPVADALVTSRRDVVLGIVTADCGPILFADQAAGVIGAAHAGWRGAQSGVIENTLAAMETLGASTSNVVAVLGPTIAQPSYEVDAAFREHFTREDDVHFEPAPTREGIARWHFDLPGYIIAKLRRCGVAEAISLGRDTYGEEGHFYSFRRASQRGEPNYGRQLSAIALPAA